MAGSDFGKYLAVVQERDVDLLLMEEFHSDPLFTRWFGAQLGLSEIIFDGAWHSVTDADGETDLLLRVIATNDERIAILIENKIAASEQERQAERYHVRAARAQALGYADRVITCMIAPSAYLSGLTESFGYDVGVPYEEIAGWFGRHDDPRSRWRHAVMLEAIEQGRRGYRMIVNEAVSRFHMDFWTHLSHHQPDLQMRRPTPKGAGSSWIRFKGTGFPARVEMALKLDQSIIELSFLGRHVEELRATDRAWPEDAIISQKGKTAAVHLSTPVLDKTGVLAEQGEALERTLMITRQLIPYANLFATPPA